LVQSPFVPNTSWPYEKTPFYQGGIKNKILCQWLLAVMGWKHFDYFNPKWYLDQLGIRPTAIGHIGNGPTGIWTN
jgi:hypothetical protein